MASSLFLVSITLVVLTISDVDLGRCGPTVVLPLRQAFPAMYPVHLNKLQARDRVRHTRVFKHNVGGGVNISVVYDDLFEHIGLYVTKVMVGSPPREFQLLFDTGSDVTWVPCISCSGCPRTTGGSPVSFYDHGSSSTAKVISCKHQLCTYNITYADQDKVFGYYVSDQIHFDMITRQFASSESVIFGCTTYESGMITWSPYKGVVGFGPGDASIISQLSSRGLTPKVFSHCLRRDDNGGGVPALGEIIDPRMVYTPLVPAMNYNVDLQSIAANGKLLSIDPAIFSTSHDRGTLIDSGTTVAYLVEEAYYAFVSAINFTVSKSVNHSFHAGNQYYAVSSSTSLAEAFPPVSLNFAGGVSMMLKPEEYLLNISYYKGVTTWAIAFNKADGGYTVFGDVVLKNKIIVYDLARRRLGWANHDCSLPLNVSVTFGKDEGPKRRHQNGSSSSSDVHVKLLIGIFFIHFKCWSQSVM
ncbi:hypothetical protein ACFX2A_026133 [Malus domestica]